MVLIRDFHENDASVCVDIAMEAFKDEIERGMQVFTSEYFVKRQGWKAHKLVVAEDDDIVGFMMVTDANTFVPAQLHLVAVDREHRRRGIGKQLVQYAIKYTVDQGWMKLKLSTRPWNTGMRKLCESLEFDEEGLLRKEYLNEDLIQYGYFPQSRT